MHADDERILLRRVVVGRVEEPALYGEVVAGPVDRFGFAPQGLEGVVVVRDGLRRSTQRANVNLGSARKGALAVSHCAVGGDREALLQASIAD